MLLTNHKNQHELLNQVTMCAYRIVLHTHGSRIIRCTSSTVYNISDVTTYLKNENIKHSPA